MTLQDVVYGNYRILVEVAVGKGCLTESAVVSAFFLDFRFWEVYNTD